MDINIDQSTPRNDLTRDEQGEYRYRLRPDLNDINRFNRDFTQYEVRRQYEMDRLLNDKLADLNNPEPEVPYYNKTLGEILIETKDSMFNLLDDLLAWEFEADTFTKNNRPFFIGVCLIITAILVFLFSFIMSVTC